jgi:hypothetical protein
VGKRYDLAVKVGEYQKDGQTKGRYQSIGAVIDGEKGPYILLDRYFNPAGIPNPDNRSNVIVSMFEPRNSGGGQQQGPPTGDGFNDDIPW